MAVQVSTKSNSTGASSCVFLYMKVCAWKWGGDSWGGREGVKKKLMLLFASTINIILADF